MKMISRKHIGCYGCFQKNIKIISLWEFGNAKSFGKNIPVTIRIVHIITTVLIVWGVVQELFIGL